MWVWVVLVVGYNCEGWGVVELKGCSSVGVADSRALECRGERCLGVRGHVDGECEESSGGGGGVWV